jgi:hypothetical protein
MWISKTGILDELVTTVTLNNVSKLITGLYAYADGLPAGTKIASFGTSPDIVLSNLPKKTTVTAVPILFTDAQPFQKVAICQDLKNVQNLIKMHGKLIQFVIRTEAEVTHDAMGSIKSRALTPLKVNMYAFPVINNPNKLQIEKSGLREMSDLIITTASKDWDDIGLTLDEIDLIRSTFIIDDQLYMIRDKAPATQIANTFLNYNFGLVRR